MDTLFCNLYASKNEIFLRKCTKYYYIFILSFLLLLNVLFLQNKFWKYRIMYQNVWRRRYAAIYEWKTVTKANACYFLDLMEKCLEKASKTMEVYWWKGNFIKVRSILFLFSLVKIYFPCNHFNVENNYYYDYIKKVVFHFLVLTTQYLLHISKPSAR